MVLLVVDVVDNDPESLSVVEDVPVPVVAEPEDVERVEDMGDAKRERAE